MQTERDKFQLPKGNRATWFWPAAVLLLATSIGIAWVGFPLTTKNTVPPKPLAAAPAAPDSVAIRLSALEQKVGEWLTERSGIMTRIAQVEKSMTSAVRRARSEATAMVEGVKREMGQGLEAIQARLTGIESTQQEAHQKVARLEEDIATARRDLESVREMNTQLANHLTQIRQEQQFARNEVSSLQNRVQVNQDRVDGLTYQVDRRRVDFELLKDRTDEVAAGIYLTINNTDVSRQQVDGWVQVSRDGRIIWLQDAGVQHPVAFSSQGEERPYQVVFTRIADRSATGYLLIPTPPVNTATAELR